MKTNTIDTILKDWDKLTDELFGLGKLHSWNFKDMAMTAFLSQALKTVQDDMRDEIFQFIWDHRTAEDGETLFVKFKMKDFKKFKEDK